MLLTRVEYLKRGEDRNFAIVDAAMNDLMRPALYDAWHDVVPVTRGARATRRYESSDPICESGDFLARDRDLRRAKAICSPIMSAGAYGDDDGSNYNTRPRAAEVMVDGRRFILIREREEVRDLIASRALIALNSDKNCRDSSLRDSFRTIDVERSRSTNYQ